MRGFYTLPRNARCLQVSEAALEFCDVQDFSEDFHRYAHSGCVIVQEVAACCG